MRYQRCTTLGCKVIRIRNSKVLAKTQFLSLEWVHLFGVPSYFASYSLFLYCMNWNVPWLIQLNSFSLGLETMWIPKTKKWTVPLGFTWNLEFNLFIDKVNSPFRVYMNLEFNLFIDKVNSPFRVFMKPWFLTYL